MGSASAVPTATTCRSLSCSLTGNAGTAKLPGSFYEGVTLSSPKIGFCLSVPTRNLPGAEQKRLGSRHLFPLVYCVFHTPRKRLKCHFPVPSAIGAAGYRPRFARRAVLFRAIPETQLSDLGMHVCECVRVWYDSCSCRCSRFSIANSKEIARTGNYLKLGLFRRRLTTIITRKRQTAWEG